MRGVTPILCASLVATAALAGPISAERKSQFEKGMSLILAAVLPAMSENLRQTVIKDYLESQPNKAQAIEPTTGHPWRSSKNEDLDAAAERALEGCQLRYGKPCALLALNDEIAAEGELKTKDMPRLQYAGELDLAKIPTIRPSTLARADLQNYLGAAGPKAIAIHPWGTLFISTGRATSSQAQFWALSDCNADPRRMYKDGNCFLYAIDNQVVLPERHQVGK
jgi:hypothetical protein